MNIHFESVDPSSGPSLRVHVLDVLRGIALLGMFLVHFSDHASGGAQTDTVYAKIVGLFFEERFWTMFGILFGAGFAIQLRRMSARGEPFIARYVRRIAGLALFGFIAHAVFGYNVLLSYAVWALALLAMRNWSTRVLVVALIVSAMSASFYLTTRAIYGVATKGEQRFRSEQLASQAQTRALVQDISRGRNSPDYRTVFVSNLRHMRWFYAQWYSFLPANTLTLFLLGVLALRLGIFDRIEEHRRLIVGLMIFGVVSWAINTWWPVRVSPPNEPLPRRMILGQLSGAFGLFRSMWLSFTYIGAILLLVNHNPAWLRRLSAFAWTGRMALTNYMVQIAILNLVFAKYALGVSTMTPLAGMTAALALFAMDALFSRWWLARHPYGPLEWLWRSMTYARWQPWRNESPTSNAALLMA